MLTLIAALMSTSLALMYVSGRMHGREERAAWRVEEINTALEVGRRNGLAYCKSEYHPLIEERCAREANYARVEYLRESGVREADARAEGIELGRKNEAENCEKSWQAGIVRGHQECEATHQKRDGKGHFLPK